MTAEKGIRERGKGIKGVNHVPNARVKEGKWRGERKYKAQSMFRMSSQRRKSGAEKGNTRRKAYSECQAEGGRVRGEKKYKAQSIFRMPGSNFDGTDFLLLLFTSRFGFSTLSRL